MLGEIPVSSALRNSISRLDIYAIYIRRPAISSSLPLSRKGFYFLCSDIGTMQLVREGDEIMVTRTLCTPSDVADKCKRFDPAFCRVYTNTRVAASTSTPAGPARGKGEGLTIERRRRHSATPNNGRCGKYGAKCPKYDAQGGGRGGGEGGEGCRVPGEDGKRALMATRQKSIHRVVRS